METCTLRRRQLYYNWVYSNVCSMVPEMATSKLKYRTAVSIDQTKGSNFKKCAGCGKAKLPKTMTLLTYESTMDTVYHTTDIVVPEFVVILRESGSELDTVTWQVSDQLKDFSRVDMESRS